MELARRIRWMALASPVALAAAVAVGQPAPPGVAMAARPQAEPTTRPPVERPCETDASPPGLAAAAAWYRLDPVLDTAGSLAGQLLVVGVGHAGWAVSLPPESFASGPVGGRVLVGDDDGQRSRLRMLDAARGCWTAVGTSSDVVRSAASAIDGTRVYEHRVERATRRDLGVWSRDLSTGGADAVPVLDGLEADPAHGPTFTTSILAAADGRIVVSSCGELACRTRVVDPRTGGAVMATGTGPAIGVAGQRLVVLGVCHGVPCGVDAVDLESGVITALGETDGTAVVTPEGAGSVVFAAPDGIGILRLGGHGQGDGVPESIGLAPLVSTSTAESGAEAPEGLVAVAPGGRVSDPRAIRFLDPAAAGLAAGEVLP